LLCKLVALVPSCGLTPFDWAFTAKLSMLFESAKSGDSGVECGLLVVAICAMGFLAFLSFALFLLYSSSISSRRHVEDRGLSLHLAALREQTSKRKGSKPRCKLQREERRMCGKQKFSTAAHRSSQRLEDSEDLSHFNQLQGLLGLLHGLGLQRSCQGPLGPLGPLGRLEMKTTRDAAQQTQWLVDTEQVLEERERLAMQLEEARQGTKLAEDEVARLLTELSQSAKDIQQLYLHLYTSRNVENDIREENAALKEELKTVREAMPDVEQMQVELKKLRGIVDDLKHDCLCPIRQSPMNDPVVAADGHSYDRKAIERWVCAHGTSPMTNMTLAHMAFVPNILASKLVACLGRSDPSWRTLEESGPSDDENDESSEHTPHAWSSDHSSSERDSPSEGAGSQHQGQAAEVLRALLSHDNIYAPVEAIWNIRNGDLQSSNLMTEARNPPGLTEGIRRPTGPIAFDDTW